MSASPRACDRLVRRLDTVTPPLRATSPLPALPEDEERCAVPLEDRRGAPLDKGSGGGEGRGAPSDEGRGAPLDVAS